MKKGYVIAVVGATGIVGKELALALSKRAEFPLSELKLFATAKNHGENIFLNNIRHTVLALPKDPLSLAYFDNVDVVILACPAKETRRLAPIFLDEGIVVIDIGGWAYPGAPKSISRLQEHEEFFEEERYISIPISVSTIISRVVHQLKDFGILGIRAHVQLGASYRGSKAVGELASQVSAVYSYQDAPQVFFPGGLAFDIVPSGEHLDEEREQIQLQVAHILNLEEQQVDISVCYVPVFSGLGISLQILMHNATVETIVEQFKGSSFGWAHEPHGPKKLMGSGIIHLGNARMDAMGHGVHLWVSADGISAGIVENCISVMEKHIDRELL